MNTLAVCTVFGALILSAGDDIATLIRKDKAALQGIWKVTAAEDNGEKVPADDIKDMFLIFKADAIFIRESGKTDEKFGYLLDPTKKPREIDLTLKAGPKKGQTDRAIYQIDGDNLRICIQSNKDAPRPSDFLSRPGSQRSLVVLRKTKE